MKNKKLISILLFVGNLLWMLSCGKAPADYMFPIDKNQASIIPTTGMVDSFEVLSLGHLPGDSYNSQEGSRAFWCDGVVNSSADNSWYIAYGTSYDGSYCAKIIFHHRGSQGGSTGWKTTLGPVTSRFTNAFSMSNISGDMTCLPRDFSDYQYLSFMIRSQNGTENLKVGLRDIYSPSGSQSAVPIGDIVLSIAAQYWQVVRVPLDKFKGVDLSKLTDVVFVLDQDVSDQSGTVYVDDIQFTR